MKAILLLFLVPLCAAQLDLPNGEESFAFVPPPPPPPAPEEPRFDPRDEVQPRNIPLPLPPRVEVTRGEQREPIKIIRSEVSPFDGPRFRYLYETENGITEEREGVEGSQGQANMNGFYTFTLPDGTLAEFRFTADEGGYVVESPLIPPMPAHAQEQIEFAAQQRAAGVEWDEQGFVI